MFDGVVDCGDGRVNECVVFNFYIFDWNIEIDTNENAFAGKIEIAYRELVHLSIAKCQFLECAGLTALCHLSAKATLSWKTVKSGVKPPHSKSSGIENA